MKAAVLYELKTPLKVEDVDLDNLESGEVTSRSLRMACVIATIPLFTVCYVLPPVVLGHEGAGIVEEIGSGVTMVKPGDHVVLSFAPYCGHCYYCSLGRPVLCDNMRLTMRRGPFSMEPPV
jgi:S-(hydroxymethyl)glutathione dehydrogenase/alcohol dehydrogenase